MNSKTIKTLAKYGIIIVLIGYIIDNLTIAVPLLILIGLAYIATKGVKKNSRRK